MRPHLILAALDEALRHQDPDDSLTAEGAADARCAARNVAEDCHPVGQRANRHLQPITAALRDWISGGPVESDRAGQYARGYEQVQRQVRLVLDGDYDVVTALLGQASDRARSQFTEAIDADPEEQP